jgi:hypothetical protein
MAKSNDKKRPAHEVRLANVKAVIWENDTKNGTMHNVVLVKVYKDGDDWKETHSLGRDELLLAVKVLDMAHSWIFEQQAANKSEQKEAA